MEDTSQVNKLESTKKALAARVSEMGETLTATESKTRGMKKVDDLMLNLKKKKKRWTRRSASGRPSATRCRPS